MEENTIRKAVKQSKPRVISVSRELKHLVRLRSDFLVSKNDPSNKHTGHHLKE